MPGMLQLNDTFAYLQETVYLRQLSYHTSYFKFFFVNSAVYRPTSYFKLYFINSVVYRIKLCKPLFCICTICWSQPYNVYSTVETSLCSMRYKELDYMMHFDI